VSGPVCGTALQAVPFRSSFQGCGLRHRRRWAAFLTVIGRVQFVGSLPRGWRHLSLTSQHNTLAASSFGVLAITFRKKKPRPNRPIGQSPARPRGYPRQLVQIIDNLPVEMAGPRRAVQLPASQSGQTPISFDRGTSDGLHPEFDFPLWQRDRSQYPAIAAPTVRRGSHAVKRCLGPATPEGK